MSLWNGIDLPVIGLTGDFASGKSLFALSICPQEALVDDIELSTAPYTGMWKERRDFCKIMQERYPKGYGPINLFETWLDMARQVPAGKFKVWVLDPISEIESGLADWVRQNPHCFGKTSAQFTKMEGLFWGCVKDRWKMILSELASKVETFVFTSHLRQAFEGNVAIKGKKNPKGKETLMELASLYLFLDRKPDKDGKVPARPAATVLKSRLSHTRLNPETGEVEIVPILPPRLPVATPATIRQYIAKPADYGCLSEEERVKEESLSEDERLMLKTAGSLADRDAAALKLEAITVADRIQQQKQAQYPVPVHATPAPPPAPPVASNELPSLPTPTEQEARLITGGDGVTAEQLEELKFLIQRLQVPRESIQAAVEKRGVHTLGQLTQDQAKEMIANLRNLAMQRDLAEDLERIQTGG